MSIFRNKAGPLALFALFALLLAATAHSSAGSRGETVAPPDQPVPALGTIFTTGDTVVVLNGNEVRNGATVFPGSALRTLERAAAVRLEPLGRLDIAPKTTLRLDFGEGRIAAVLEDGCVVLTANKGVTGELTLPDGVTKRTDPADRGVLDYCCSVRPGGGGCCQGAAAAAGAIIPAGHALSPYLFALGAPAVLTIDTNNPRPADASSTTP